MYTSFLGTKVTCYIKFKLLYKFIIVAFFFLSKYNYIVYIRDGPRWGPKGVRAPLGPIIYIYIYSYNIFHLCNWSPFKTLDALSP